MAMATVSRSSSVGVVGFSEIPTKQNLSFSSGNKLEQPPHYLFSAKNPYCNKALFILNSSIKQVIRLCSELLVEL